MATTMATMKAPVATNRWNLALTAKNTKSGPASVASLKSGCGWVLSITKPSIRSPPAGCPALVGQDKSKSRVDPCNRPREISRSERGKILHTLADADEVHRQLVLLRQGDEDAAARSAVKLGHHQTRDSRRTMKRFHLRQRILSHRGIEHQEHRVRRRGVHLADDANDLFQLIHQLGLVLQAAGGVDQKHVDCLLLCRGERIEG